MITVHLFGTEKSLQGWLAANCAAMAQEGWMFSRSQQYVYERGSDRYMLISAGNGAQERLRGFTIDELKVDGPWHDHLLDAEDAARQCMRPQ